MKIQTTKGEMDDTEVDENGVLVLEKVVETLDEPTRFAHRITYRHAGEVVAVYELPMFPKVNPFEADAAGGVVLTDHQDGRPMFEMAVSELEKKTGVIDDDNEFTCWVEYRPLGTDKIVHRSVDVKLKRATVTGEAVAAQL